MSFKTEGEPTAASPTAENETENEGAEALESSTAAESSNADDDGAQPKDLLSVVRDAVKKEDGEAESPTAEGAEEAAAAEAEAKPEGEAEGDDQAAADAKLPFHQHPRWKEVIAERDSFKEDAQHFRKVDGFMREHGLSAEEVGEGFDIMAKLKSGDPANLAEVREYFAKNLALLDGALGNVLPEDLQQRVESGALDDDAAQELARARAEKSLRERTETARTAEAEHGRAQEAAIANAQASATAVTEWEASKRQADPDYARKAGLIEMACRAIVMETGKAPTNPTEAVALADKAYERVSTQLRDALPKPKPVKTTPTGSSVPTKTEQPKTLKGAILSALGDG